MTPVINPPSAECLLLTRILFHPEEYEYVKKIGFNPSFLGPAYVLAFKELDQYRSTHRELPGAKYLLKATPGVHILHEDPPKPATVYWEAIHYLNWRKALLATLSLLADQASKEEKDRPPSLPFLAELTTMANQQFAEIAARYAADNDRADLGSSVAPELIAEQENPEEHQGIPIPFEFLQEELRGFKPGQMYVVAGRPKSGKSWFALICAAAAIAMRKRVLIMSLEMRKRELVRRLACIMGRVSFNRVMKKAFKNQEEKDRYYATVDALKRDYGNLFVVAGPGAAKTPEAVDALHRSFNADMVVVDSFYRMEATGEKDWERIQYLIRRFSRLTMLSNAPWIMVTQFNRGGKGRGGAHLGNLAFSDAIGQDANALIYVVRNNFLKKAGQVDLILGEAREADDKVAVRHKWDFREMHWDPVAVVDYGSDDQEV